MIDFNFIRPGGPLDKFSSLLAEGKISISGKSLKGNGNCTMDGLYSGYTIETIYGDKKFTITTKDGVRGINIPVKVEVNDGVWKAYLKDRELEIVKVIEYVVRYDNTPKRRN